MVYKSDEFDLETVLVVFVQVPEVVPFGHEVIQQVLDQEDHFFYVEEGLGVSVFYVFDPPLAGQDRHYLVPAFTLGESVVVHFDLFEVLCEDEGENVVVEVALGVPEIIGVLSALLDGVLYVSELVFYGLEGNDGIVEPEADF